MDDIDIDNTFSIEEVKDIIWRRRKPGSDDKSEYFSAFRGDYFTTKRGYNIHWIYSNDKRKRDRDNREKHLKKAEQCLALLNGGNK